MRPASLITLASLAALLGASIGGCASADHDPINGTANRCSTNADCPSGSTCSSTTAACVSVNATTEVVFFAAPPHGAYTPTAAPTRLDSNLVSGDSAFEIRLRAPRQVYGLLAAPPPMMAGINPMDGGGTTAEPTPIPATLTFRRQGSTPAEQLVTVRATTDTRPTPDGFPYNFSANLVPGTYDVTITPDPSGTTRVGDLPPWYVQQVVEPNTEGQALGVINLVWGATLFHGKVRDQENVPVPNVQVRLVDHANNDRALSTTGLTASNGEFNVYVSPAPDSSGWPNARFEISTGVAGTGNQVSTRFVYQVDRLVLPLPGDDGIPIVPLEARGIALAPYLTCAGCVPIQGTVEGTRIEGPTDALANATVTLRNDAPFGSTLPAGHVAWFEARMQTAADGTYSVMAPSGTYRALIVPSTPSQFAVGSDLLEVGAGGQMGHAIEMPQQTIVQGNLRDRSRNDVARVGNAVIEFVPVAAYLPAGTDGDHALDLLARPAQTVTQPNGYYTIGLDPGPYRVVMRPPPESGYANEVDEGLLWVQPSPPRQPPMSVAHDLNLDAPVQVRGQVVDAQGAGVGSAMVTAFARIAFTRGPSDPFVPPLDIALGTFVANADGQYACLLPRTQP